MVDSELALVWKTGHDLCGGNHTGSACKTSMTVKYKQTLKSACYLYTKLHQLKPTIYRLNIDIDIYMHSCTHTEREELIFLITISFLNHNKLSVCYPSLDNIFCARRRRQDREVKKYKSCSAGLFLTAIISKGLKFNPGSSRPTD